MPLIDWRSWALCALARRLGFAAQHVGVHSTTGDRGFIFGSTESSARELALNLSVFDAYEREHAALKTSAKTAAVKAHLGVH